MKFLSSAKINLNLEVNSETKDGLHTLTSYLIPIDIYDVIEINEIDEKNDKIIFTPDIELKGKSTIEKSLDLLRESNNFEKYYEVKVTKNIPIEGGLGGGSSNAGSIIKYICNTYDLALPKNEDIAKKVGSDVPYFIEGKPGVISGIGEEVCVDESIGDLDILIATPYEKISTVDAFQAFDKLGDKNQFKKSKIKNMEIFNNMWNPALAIEPRLQDHKEHLEEVFNIDFYMSGTGSTLFGIGEYDNLENSIKKVDKTRFRLIKITKKIDCSLLFNAD